MHEAKRDGTLLRPDGCEECGGAGPVAHHDDYTKPLDVRWLCQSCHKVWHGMNTPITPDAPKERRSDPSSDDSADAGTSTSLEAVATPEGP